MKGVKQSKIRRIGRTNVDGGVTGSSRIVCKCVSEFSRSSHTQSIEKS